MSKWDLLKKLEYLVAFQTERLDKGDWESFDKTEGEIERLEKSILISKE